MLGPLAFFLVIDVPLSVLCLMEGLLEQVFNCGFENGHDVFVLVLDDVVLFFVLLVWWFVVFVGFGFDLVSFFLDLEDLFRGLEDAVLDLVDLAEELPVGHAVFPCVGARVDFAGSEEDVKVSEGEGSSGLIIDDYIPNFLFKFLYFIVIHFQSIINSIHQRSLYSF